MLVELEAAVEDHLGDFDQYEMADHFTHLANRSFRWHGNVIEAAVYFAAAENEEYCAGGFRN